LIKDTSVTRSFNVRLRKPLSDQTKTNDFYVVVKVQRTSMESRLPGHQALEPVSLFRGLDTEQYKQRRIEYRRKPGEHAEP